jgi:hypothetical protein
VVEHPPCEELATGGEEDQQLRRPVSFLVSTTPKNAELVIDLPEAVVWVSLEGCTPVP